VAKEAKKIGKEARIVYATSEGTRVAASEKAVDKLIEEVGRGETIGERFGVQKIPFGEMKLDEVYFSRKANKLLAKGVYIKAPYKPGTKVFEATVEKEIILYRVYKKDGDIVGQFFTVESEIKGLTPKQIQEKLALSYEPYGISKVILKPGEKIRFGVVNENYGHKGGGLQFDLMDVHLEKDRFIKTEDL
jgi:hypothetical protein